VFHDDVRRGRMRAVTGTRSRRVGARGGSGRGGPLPAWLRWAVVVVLAAVGVGAADAFVSDARTADWAVAASVFAAYVAGALVAGVLLALALHRWSSAFFRIYFFGGYLSLYLAWALFTVPVTGITGLQFAESVQCHRLDGVVVQAHYVDTSYSGGRYNFGDNSSWVGEYTVGGRTHHLVIDDDYDVYGRQVAMAYPDGEVTDPTVIRSYEVAWVGSTHACARGSASDFWRGTWIVVAGPWLALGPILAVLALRRRLRATDESSGATRSQPA